MKVFRVLALGVALGVAAASTVMADGPWCGTNQALARQIENLPNGVKITLTSKDPKVVADVQSKADAWTKEGCKDCPMHAQGVTRVVEKISNGVVVTTTAKDPQLVKAVQKHAEGFTGGCAKTAANKKSCCSKEEAKGCAKGTAAPARPTT